MKLPVRILLALLCAALIAGMPLYLSSPAILFDAEMSFYEEDGDAEEPLDFSRLFLPAAMAEEAAGGFSESEEIDPEELTRLRIPDSWELPLDFTVPPAPDPDGFTESGYEDKSIRVQVETRRLYDSDVTIAFVEVASASQLRTATAYGVKSQRTLRVSDMARSNNAVIAMNADDFIQKESDGSNAKIFEIRMGQVVPNRKKINTHKDTLAIDDRGDFHLFILGKGLKDYMADHMAEIVNGFCFGPALVKDGEIVEHESYWYNRTGDTPRSAIGQTGPLSYVLVVVEGRGNNNQGVSHEELARIMKDIGCVQAYNLDGGNSAELVMPGPDPDRFMILVNADNTANKERGQSDIIYFATAVPEEER